MKTIQTKTLEDVLRQTITKPAPTTEQLMKTLPGLTLREAMARVEHTAALRAKLIAEGRCLHCGVQGHSIDQCALYLQSENEITKEALRRSKLRKED